MANNVVRLPRPKDVRGASGDLGLYVRVGRNQHKEVIEALGSGEQRLHGIVIEAQNVERHDDLRDEARKLGLDVVLDPKTPAMAFPHAYTDSLSKLPWGGEGFHTIHSFDADGLRRKVDSIAEFCAHYNVSKVLAPSHVIRGANDPWLRRDVEAAQALVRALDGSATEIGVIYPLILPMQVFQDKVQRAAIISAVSDAPVEAIWLRTENFGSDASGQKTMRYIEAARDLHHLGIPIVSDYAGGLSALGLLAFGAVGGVCHGVTLLDGFKISHWRRAPSPNSKPRVHATRAYFPNLDMMLTKAETKLFLGSSSRVKGVFGCSDTHCCPRGTKDMLEHPAKHFLHQRINQVRGISQTPSTLRVEAYLEGEVRKASDDVASAAAMKKLPEKLLTKFGKKQINLARFRHTIGHFAKVDTMESVSALPSPRGRANIAD